MITQKDISAACGLSVATVSKALCDSSDIADETKLRVRTMAEKMGYGKEMPARRTRISFRIGIMVNGEEGTDFQHELIDEVQKRLLERGYDLVLFSSAAGAGGDTGKPGLLSRAKVLDLDGIFLFNLGPEEDVFHPGEDRDRIPPLPGSAAFLPERRGLPYNICQDPAPSVPHQFENAAPEASAGPPGCRYAETGSAVPPPKGLKLRQEESDASAFRPSRQ